MDFRSFEKRGWSDPQTAKSYTEGFVSAAEHSVPVLVGAVKASEGSVVLDLCCGQGSVAAGLHAAGAKVTGLDFSPAMLEIARDLVPGVAFIEGDAMNLPFDDCSFDAVTMGFGILHVPDATAAVAQVARVLRPGGRFAYSCWHGAEKVSALPAVFGAIQRHGDLSIELPDSLPAPHYAQPENATPLMKDAGLKDIGFETVNSTWTCKSADDPVTYFMNGTVRGAGLLKSQPAENFEAIRREVMAWVESNGMPEMEHGTTQVPLPAVVVSARKPM